MVKKPSLLVPFAFAAACVAYAQTGSILTLALDPAVISPLGGSDSHAEYSLGAMASLQAEWVPRGLPFLTVSGAIDYSQAPLTVDPSLALRSIGASAGLGLRLPIARFLALGLSGRGGIGAGMLGDVTAPTPYAIAGLDASFSLTPSLSLGLAGGYLHQFAASSPLYQGLSLGLVAGLNLSKLDTKPRLRILDVALSPVFPVFYKHYDSNPLGSAELVNEEGGLIKGVEVSVFAPQYMDAPKACAAIPSMRRGERATVDLYALFTRQVLTILEPTKAQVELIVEYEYEGTRKVVKSARTIVLNHRNASAWDDDRKAAAFVTLNDPAVMRLAKAAAGTARSAGYATTDTNLRQAIGVLEGLRLYGIEYVPDAAVPYERRSKDEEAVDYLQFPAQTLDFHAGDCDDMSILYAALLEASGVESAFLTVPGHIYAAFALSMPQAEGRQFFSNYADVIEAEGKLWLPVEVTILGEGFMRAWQIGARQWRDAAAKGEARLYPVRDAWKLYEPVAVIGDEASIAVPRADALVERYRASMDALLAREMAKPLAEAKAAAASAQSPAALNRLGVVYAKYGDLAEAEKAFLASVKLKENPSGYVNLGGVYRLRSDYRKSLEAFRKALALSPRSISALAGAAIASFELDDRAGATRYLDELSKQDAAYAGRFAYIQSGSGSRASSAAGASAVAWEE